MQTTLFQIKFGFLLLFSQFSKFYSDFFIFSCWNVLNKCSFHIITHKTLENPPKTRKIPELVWNLVFQLSNVKLNLSPFNLTNCFENSKKCMKLESFVFRRPTISIFKTKTTLPHIWPIWSTARRHNYSFFRNAGQCPRKQLVYSLSPHILSSFLSTRPLRSAAAAFPSIDRCPPSDRMFAPPVSFFEAKMLSVLIMIGMLGNHGNQ